VALATNAFPPLLKRLSYYVVPVYDYALMTEPLSPAQRDSIGWHGREGVSDASRQFHYTRTTADGRILWGGYDAVYYWNNGFGTHLETSQEMFGRLAEHFFQTFPQLEGLRFSHAWGGAIDTCSRFAPFWGTAHHGRTAYSMGFTGLGVGATRFGAKVMLDLLDDKRTERTRSICPHQAAALPAGTVALHRHQPDALVHGPRGPQRRTREPVAARHGLAWTGDS
jgi:glycine/D-amino acid oxidase-like deaminating enzyme